MHTNQEVSNLQTIHTLPNTSQLHQNSAQMSNAHQEEVGNEQISKQDDTLMKIIPKVEQAQRVVYDAAKGVKITPPQYRNIISEWGNLPDFSCLPDIPKLSVKFTIDEITNAPSHIINSSTQKSEKLSKLSYKNKGGQQVNKGDIPKSEERRVKFEQN